MEEEIHIKKFCKKCDNEFLIREDDIEFYESIDSDSEDYCPKCRMIKHPEENKKDTDWSSNPFK